MKPPSVQDKVLAKLKSQEWVGADEFDLIFPKGVEGHFSWDNRLRGLREARNGGYIIIHRTKAGTKHLTEWHIEGQEKTTPIAQPEPPTPTYFEVKGQYAFCK